MRPLVALAVVLLVAACGGETVETPNTHAAGDGGDDAFSPAVVPPGAGPCVSSGGMCIAVSAFASACVGSLPLACGAGYACCNEFSTAVPPPPVQPVDSGLEDAPASSTSSGSSSSEGSPDASSAVAACVSACTAMCASDPDCEANCQARCERGG